MAVGSCLSNGAWAYALGTDSACDEVGVPCASEDNVCALLGASHATLNCCVSVNMPFEVPVWSCTC